MEFALVTSKEERAMIHFSRILVIAATVALNAGMATWARERSVERQILALTYPEGPTISVKFDGTSRLPGASGEAKVERKKGMTEIEIELDEMKPAAAFGGQYNTYVLWVVSPEGHVDNLGEFILQGNRSKLNVSTPLETFGMFVTAEPHFLTSLPSRFVALENSRPTLNLGPLKDSILEYQGFDGVYQFERESLADLAEVQGEVRSHIESARTAVELAEGAGAAKFAAAELTKARAALKTAEARYTSGTSGPNEMLLAHEVIRLAVDAEEKAKERAFEAALARERSASSDRITDLKAAIAAAQSEAERNRLTAENKALDAEIEARARHEAEQEAAEAARRAAEAEERAHAAEEERIAAEHAKLDAERAKTEAERGRVTAEHLASEARLERENARAELREAMARITAVRESARGLIVSLPNILFETSQARLKPEGREALAKISGVLMIAEGYTLSVEGHTDKVGSAEYNLDLSEKRAASVRDYLVEQGLSPANITVKGFGETQPVAANETAAGRQENRRVEIVVLETPDFGTRPTSQ
jgi:outer membrane protein OmpA-like peptidoglycan-associated protein